MQTKFPTSVLTDTKESNSVEEKKSLDNVALFDKSPQRDASGTLAPFTKQAPVLSNMHIRITEIVYPIATWVSLLIPLVGREDMMLNGHLEQDMETRYVVTNSLGSGPPKWKFDLGTFTVGMADLFLDEYFLEVWDPGQLGCVKSNWFKVFSIVDKCNALTCPLIAYSLVFAEYYVVQHDILVANFEQTSVLHLRCITALVGMVQVWEDEGLLGDQQWFLSAGHVQGVDSGRDMYSACYTLYGIIEIVESVVRHKLHHGLVERFGRRRALTTIAQYFEVNNCSIDKSMQLSNNETTMSTVLQVANEVASLLLTNLTIRGDAHVYSNLEDKVLIGVGSIVMNGPRPVLAKTPNTELSDYVWDPG
ncbi:hypothetical protein MTR67_008293 [Solanum verrucosum]|uniref:Uncharacterized protein n=1 Tax=Solanum verrucosum TaxID=315347 RepID=A0AAF0Q1P5_SOLVR|nr:hypothetical protein MTR67_008293 [Solanum verrucosum]